MQLMISFSFTCVIKMHRMYICTWFMCLPCTAKMALFTGLEHSDNTKHWSRAVASERVKGSSKPSQVLKPNKVLKRSITSAFPCLL